MSTATLDQLGAATREARSIIDGGAALDERIQVVDRSGPFAAAVLADVRRLAKRGRLLRCRHLSGRGPAPTWLVAWRPGRAFCERCVTAELIRTRDTAEDLVCDVCRTPAPSGLWSAIGHVGLLLLTYGACDNCYRVETGRVTS